jgi:GNAT superfamily N-acetyltransferase
MNHNIEALNPKNALEYLEYLDKMDFHHAPEWAGCFCRYYHNDCSDALWQKRSAAENKAEALKAIQQGTMKGYLAFDHKKVIGWINANHVAAYPRLSSFIEPYVTSKQMGCVVCFVIHPQYRNQGIARQIVGSCCQ